MKVYIHHFGHVNQEANPKHLADSKDFLIQFD